MQEILPSHVQQVVDEAWAVRLEQQAVIWKAARLGRGSIDQAGVLVVRRPVRSRAAAALRATDRRAL
jgi:hypothetical protein